jgi:hypothetical protein
MTTKSKFSNNNTLPENLRQNQLRYDAKKNYGLSIEQVRNLREQPCDICGKKAKKMCIDHKVPGTYRGVLCQQCNSRLGWLEQLCETILVYKDREPQNKVNL